MKTNNSNNKFFSKKMSRKEAIKKVGVTALTTTTLLFLQTKAQAGGSPDTDGAPQGNGSGRGGRG
jgi:hypothetical protein